ncbi:gamma-aminobutyric acid type B receptor subunit 1-like [Gigantopelta aegis]|uniref:gamma-aminobutyric acid type B receptor subunit 1-like n=1 Tax=Gigantopelta aegis TaxID=1735272 RepID=UPI001B887C83|nr:gamma-aminobutyric acid type B receptor subunit 1-like [Gigantopelta aegis]
MALYPFHGAWHGGAAVLAASQLALEQVNQRDDVLPGYRLNLLWNDTGCDPGLGLDLMFQHLYSPPTKIMIIGALCSIVSQATAQVSHRWNVVQLSPVSSSPALSNKSRFKMFLRTNSPDSDINPAKIEMFTQFGWSKIATIHQAFELFSVANDGLIGLMKKKGMTVVTSEIITTDPIIQVRNLQESGARIIVGSFYADMAVRVFCEAYKIGLYGPKIAWILVGWYSENWWNVSVPNTDCTIDQIKEAIDGYFAVDPIRVNPKPELTISGQTAHEIQKLFLQRINHEPLPALNSGLQGFDAIWTAALALNKTMTDLENNGSARLENFTYQDTEMGKLLFNNAMNTEFPGVRGWISFNKKGDLNSIYRIDRFQDHVNISYIGESHEGLQFSSCWHM